MTDPAADDPERLRREILDEVGALLREHLAADAWGRLLVEVVAGAHGEPVVADVEVEGIVGDEARVDEAFSSEATVRPLLPVLAKATEALCGLEDVELERVGGGTWLRQVDGSFAWLPGLVHMPSPALERSWDAARSRLNAVETATAARLDLASLHVREIDLVAERITFAAADGATRVVGRATLVGSYSRASRTWAWGGSNTHLPAALRALSAALVDVVDDRTIQELSTPLFATDEATARTLCAIVCVESGGEALHREVDGDNAAYLVLRDLHAVS